MVLAGEEIGRGRHMDQDVDVGRVHSGIGQGGAPRPQRQVTVEQAALGPAPLAPPPELVVQPPLVDAQMSYDPFGLEGPAVGAQGPEVFEDLLVGHSVFRQIGAHAHQGNRDFGRQSWDRGTCHRTTSQSSEIGVSAGRGVLPSNHLGRVVEQGRTSRSGPVPVVRYATGAPARFAPRRQRGRCSCARPLTSGRVVTDRDVPGRALRRRVRARSRSCSMPADAATASTCTSGAVA